MYRDGVVLTHVMPDQNERPDIEGLISRSKHSSPGASGFDSDAVGTAHCVIQNELISPDDGMDSGKPSWMSEPHPPAISPFYVMFQR